MTGTTTLPLLAARGVSKSFGAVEALVDVDFDVDAGEVVALVGDNGAGKSTLIKAIAGVQPADTGRIWFDGCEVSIRSPQDASRLGIATVYQDFALCDNLDASATCTSARSCAALARSGPSPRSTRTRWSTARLTCSSSWR
jgi:D-xylose transport system ATP-binding protein